MNLPLAPATRASIALAAAALFWAGNFIVGRSLRGQVDPATLNLMRWLLCLAVMLPWVGARTWRSRAVIAREWRLVLGLGATGIAAFHTMVYEALAHTTAISALLLLSLAPATIWLGGALTAGTRPTSRQVAGLLLSLAGGAVVLLAGRSGPLLTLASSAGDAWMMAAVLVWTAYSLLLRKRPADLPPDVALASSIVAALLLLLPWVVARGATLPVLTPQMTWALGYIGVFASLLAFLLWTYGVATLGPERASQYIHLMPVFGLLLAVVLLGETLLPAQAVGALCVFSGLALAQQRRAAPTDPPRTV